MKNQIKLMLTFLLAIVFSGVMAQEKKIASPPAKVEGTIDGVSVTVNYNQPSAKGRKIMGELVAFGEVWRTGANATTNIEFSGNVKIEGQALAKGKYGLFTIPGENEWTVIFNKQASGSPFDYSDKQDVIRVKVKPGKTSAFVETFTIAIEQGNLTLKWENTAVAVKVTKG
jgi:heat shock protein HslJ